MRNVALKLMYVAPPTTAGRCRRTAVSVAGTLEKALAPSYATR
jgi:hypothetical protein